MSPDIASVFYLIMYILVTPFLFPYRREPGVGDVGAVLPVAAHLRPQHPRRLHNASPPQTRLHRSGSIIIHYSKNEDVLLFHKFIF